MKRSSGIRLAGAALAVGLFAGLLSACGSGSSSGSSSGTTPTGSTPTGSNAVLAAFHATSAAGSAKMSLQVGIHATTTSSSVPSLNEVITAQGSTDFANRSSQLTMTIPRVGTVQVVLVGGTAYVMLPPAEQAALGGKPWAKVDTGQAGASSGTPLGETDPSQVLSILEGAGSGVTNLGQATVRGVTTTHYHFDLNLSALAARSGQGSTSLSQGLQQLHLTSLPVDVYVDSEGRLARLATDAALPPSALADLGATGEGATSVSFQIAFDLYDYGAPVNISAPPASEVGQLPGSGLSGISGGSGVGAGSGTASPSDSVTR